MTRQQDSHLPKALLITRNLPPLLGGMERLNLHLARELADAYQLTVIGPAGCREFLPPHVETIEIPVRPLSVFIFKSLAAAWRAAADDPLFVIAGSGLTAPMVKLVAWRSNAFALAYVHGLDLVAGHPVYRLLWLPVLRRLRHAFANSASTADIAIREGVACRRVSVLHPGVSIPQTTRDARAFRSEHQLEEARILLSVGRMTARKGLVEFVREALPAIHERHADVVLVVIGDEAPDALNGSARGMGQRALAEAAALGLQNHVRLLGSCDDAELEEAYSAADVHVFPVRATAGDIEGFGMVAMEAAAHGLPTVAFGVGGVPDAVRSGCNGYLVQPGDYKGFADRVGDLLELGRDAPMRSSARQFAEGFRWERFGHRLRAALSEIQAGGSTQANMAAGHAVLDLRSRATKAQKIEALLGLSMSGPPLRLLEIGTGSGGIAHYFATHPGLNVDVEAVDVIDTRQIAEGYRFTQVAGTCLPFPDGSFDVVITNHVIEHVGDEAAQLSHLSEIHRVLAANGVGYLAVPNRWMLVEPHYRLPFLSWLPRSMRSPYLQWLRGVARYDCHPLTIRETEDLLGDAGLAFENLTVPAMRMTLELEKPPTSWLRRFVDCLPDRLATAMVGAIPTLIYRFERDELAPSPQTESAR